MADATGFTKLVPGFDFLQGLVKNAGAALPNMGQWIAPTLNPQELEKRIEELRRRGVLFKAQKIEHAYPHCWRCGTPLIYYARESWFVRTTAFRDAKASAVTKP